MSEFEAMTEEEITLEVGRASQNLRAYVKEHLELRWQVTELAAVVQKLLNAPEGGQDAISSEMEQILEAEDEAKKLLARLGLEEDSK